MLKVLNSGIKNIYSTFLLCHCLVLTPGGARKQLKGKRPFCVVTTGERVLDYSFLLIDRHETELLHMIVPEKALLCCKGILKHEISTLVLEPHSLREDLGNPRQFLAFDLGIWELSSF